MASCNETPTDDAPTGAAIIMAMLGASLVATAICLIYGVSEGMVVWVRVAGFDGMDIPNIVAAAWLFGGCPTLAAVAAGEGLDRLDTDALAGGLIFWSAPVAELGAGAICVGTAVPQAVNVPTAWGVLASGLAAVLLVGWRRGLSREAPPGVAGPEWILVGLTFYLFRLEWGPIQMYFNGPLFFALLGAVGALGLMILGLVDADLGVSSRRVSAEQGATKQVLPRLTTAVGVGAAVFAGCLPWVLPDLYGFPKLMAVICSSVVVGHLAHNAWRCAGHRVRRLAAGCAVFVGMVGTAAVCWSMSRPVASRFGSFSRQSLVGTAVDMFIGAVGEPDDSAEAAAAVALSYPHLDVVETPPSRPHRRLEAGQIEHVIIFVVDALRADIVDDPELRGRFRFLDRFVSSAVRFDNAYAPANCTLLSFGPMQTGLPPVLAAAMARQPRQRRRLFNRHWIGQSDGDHRGSALIVASPFEWMINGQFDINANFRAIDSHIGPTGHSSPALVRDFDALIDGGFFERFESTVTVGYVADPHAPYVCKDGHHGGYGCYLEEIEVVDRALEHIVERLDDARILDNALVVVTADHGESFGQMNYHAHNTGLHQPQIRVPLVMRLPGGRARVVEPPVSLRALPATVADALGTPPSVPQAYHSLLGLARGATEAAQDPVMVEHWTGFAPQRPVHRTAFIDDGFKLTYDWHTTARTLVDLSEPVSTGSDLSDAQPERTAAMLRQMFRWRRHEWATSLGDRP